MHRLTELLVASAPRSADKALKLKSYKAVSGFEKQLIHTLININQYHKNITFNSDLSGNVLFADYSNFFIDPVMPDRLNMYLLRKLYIVKLLAARSYRAIRMAKGRPVHGQRR